MLTKLKSSINLHNCLLILLVNCDNTYSIELCPQDGVYENSITDNKTIWMDVNLKNPNKEIVRCRSKQQIKWTVDPIHVLPPLNGSLPFQIKTQLMICSSTSLRFFLSTMNISNIRLLQFDNMTWTTNVTCGHFLGPNESDWTGQILIKKESEHYAQFSPKTRTHQVKSFEGKVMTLESERLVLELDKNETCLCKFGQDSFKPTFLHCDNIIDCEFFIQLQNTTIEPGVLVNNCTHRGFEGSHLNEMKAGFIICRDDTVTSKPVYAPFIPHSWGQVGGVNDTKDVGGLKLKHITILRNNVSDYGEYLKISLTHLTSISDLRHVKCAGPAFLFLKNLFWKLTAESDDNGDIFNLSNVKNWNNSDEVISTATISYTNLTKDVNLNVTCEAAVLNSNQFVSSPVFSISFETKKLTITTNMTCFLNNVIRFECRPRQGHNITWDYPESCKVENKILLCGQCPNSTVTCSLKKEELQNSTSFSPENCFQFVEDTNCSISSSIENSPPPGNEISSLTYGISGGVIALCLLIFVPCLVILIRKNRQQKAKNKLSDEEINDFLQGQEGTASSTEPSALFLPYDTALEIPTEKLKFESGLLGEGAFGEVRKGKYDDRSVAVKTVKRSAEIPYFKALLSELKIMSYIGQHENIVELVGASTANIRKREVFVVFEFCSNGNALHFIRQGRDYFQNQLSGDEFKIGGGQRMTLMKKFCSQDLVRWSYQVACGMEHVASLNVYHGDIAARNILLNEKLEAKVGDFGLSKQLFQYSVYVQKIKCPLPLKWLSIEALRDLEFSIQSDVWSFGVMLWEFFSLGSTPYPGMDWNFQAWKLLNDGHRMDCPDYATTSLHEIMLKCWTANLRERPTFEELRQKLGHELHWMERFCL